MKRNRKFNRLAGYDYSTPGVYFVTICTQGMVEHLGGVRDGRMFLNECGIIVETQWRWTFDHFDGIGTDAFAVMPNHVHGIVVIDAPIDPTADARRHNTLSKTLNAFKTTSSKHIHLAGNADFRWQRSFHDRIVRDPDEWQRIRRYIVDNPGKWIREHPSALGQPTLGPTP